MQPTAPPRLPFMLLAIALSLALALLPARAAPAAGLKALTQVTPQQAYNPVPSQGDFTLPMPCDLHMVFRAVDVPVQGFLWDVHFNMGAEDGGRDGMEYYDRRFAQNISGPFSNADVPAAWRPALPGGEGQHQYYFIGKYEVSNLQWRAVMEPQCPQQLTETDLLPKNDISWYDAIEFSRRYNEWLLAHAAGDLPRFANDDKNIGYVRLPTEPEWEYAARGGGRVPPDVLRQQSFYPLENGTTLEAYAAYRPEQAARILDAPQRIGTRRANPLGIHDMAGNVAEMMLETFHFSLGNRLHGSAGGVIRKGGGFASTKDEIMPGRREELPLMHERGPTKTRDTGMRLVLSGINTPDGGRTEKLKKEWASLGEHSAQIVPGANPLQEIDRIIGLTPDATAKTNLTTLRGVIKDFNITLEREQDAAAEGLLRTAIYMMETIRNYAVRLNISKDRIKEHTQANAELKDKKSPVYAKRQEMIAQYEAGATSFLDAIEASLLFYKSRLANLAAIPDAMYTHHLNLLRQEFAGAGVFQNNMAANINTLHRHRETAKKGQSGGLTTHKLRDDILPETLRVHLK